MKKHALSSIIYNSTTEYGASQRSPFEMKTSNPAEYTKLTTIVQKHFPKMTASEIDNLIERLKKEGCGYVCMVNSLFTEFLDRPKRFKEVFGFDMINADNSLNYNTLLVDLYCKTDNHIGINFPFFAWDTYIKNEDRVLHYNKEEIKFEWKEKPFGNNVLQMKYRFETYCMQHGIKASLLIIPFITPKTFHKYAKMGSVSILCNKPTLQKEDGTPIKVNDWHFMTITGVTKSGKYIVSSWGNRYVLDQKNIRGIRFYQVIRYKTFL